MAVIPPTSDSPTLAPSCAECPPVPDYSEFIVVDPAFGAIFDIIDDAFLYMDETYRDLAWTLIVIDAIGPHTMLLLMALYFRESRGWREWKIILSWRKLLILNAGLILLIIDSNLILMIGHGNWISLVPVLHALSLLMSAMILFEIIRPSGSKRARHLSDSMKAECLDKWVKHRGGGSTPGALPPYTHTGSEFQIVYPSFTLGNHSVNAFTASGVSLAAAKASAFDFYSRQAKPIKTSLHDCCSGIEQLTVVAEQTLDLTAHLLVRWKLIDVPAGFSYSETLHIPSGPWKMHKRTFDSEEARLRYLSQFSRKVPTSHERLYVPSQMGHEVTAQNAHEVFAYALAGYSLSLGH
jgi:hypothetical protein